MDRLERFYKIDRLLSERRLVSFADFKQELGMSPASVKRDLAYMRDRFNAPIEYDREANAYRFGEPRTGPRYELPGLWFNASEVLALLTTLRMLGELQPGVLEEQIEPLRERLRAILGSGDHSWQEVEKRIRIFQPERRAGDPKHFGVAATAVLRRAKLWIRHFNRTRGEETEREVSPQRLVHYRDNWYLDAWCHLRNDLRSFAVDAIRDVSMVPGRLKDVAESELDAVLASGYGIFSGKKVQWATLRFTPERARYVTLEEWHPKQRARREPDGAYVLEVPFSSEPELMMDILKFGPDIEVLAPPAPRAAVLDRIAAAARRY